jgi:translocation and assembly module TamA
MLLIALLIGAPAGALQLREVRVSGVDDELLVNVRGRMGLTQHPAGTALTEARLDYLVQQAPDEARQALEPFGFYDAEVEVEPRRSGDSVRVDVRIRPGDPVRVRERRIDLHGPGAADPPLAELIARFEPERGDPFDHRVYESSKRSIQRALQQRGYFDAEARTTRVEVTRASRSADIELDWDTGPRARFGELRFAGSHINEALLHSRADVVAGAPFDQAELLLLHQKLLELDYFSVIDVQPQLEEASGDPPRVPIEVSLQPAARSVYRAGLSYGTDNGAGIRLGFDRRWVNRRGDKIVSEADISQRSTAIALQYRIPAWRRLPGWWTVGTIARQERRGAIESEIGGFLVSRSFEWLDDKWTAEARVERERFDDQYTSLVYPALRWDRTRLNDPLYPNSGYGFTVQGRAGNAAIGSQVDFAQLHLQMRLAIGFGERQRLLLRGEVGRTFGDDLQQLPPSLRFFAGGDRSVRGYGYQELGPRDDDGRVIGGRNLLVASAEFEHMFTATWGGAVFVDAGNAFNLRDFSPAVGVGVGVRWRSPIGPIRLDIGHGLDQPEATVRLHLTIGPQL